MANFVAKIKAEFDKNSVKSLASSIETALAEKPIKITKIELAADSVDVTSFVNDLKKKIQTALKELNIDSILDSASAGSKKSSGASSGSSSSSSSASSIAQDAKNTTKELMASEGAIATLSKKWSDLVRTKQQFFTDDQADKANEMVKFFDDIKDSTEMSKEKLDEYNEAYKKFVAEISRRQLQQTPVTETVNKLRAQYQDFINNNDAFYKNNKSAIDEQIAALNKTGQIAPDVYRKAKDALAAWNAQAKASNQQGKSFLNLIRDQFTTFSKYTIVAEIFARARKAIQEMVTAVKEVDAAMTELKKVTDLTDAGYAQALESSKETARSVGATLSDTVNATADFARLGYQVGDAEELAKVALLYKNVGDGISDISQASESIISTMKAFNINAEESISIVDKFNEVGNNYAITSTGIGDALQKSAAALAAGGNTIDESIALITAANNVVQNPEVVGTAMKTFSMYLRAAKTEAEDAGESTDGMADSVSKLRDEILSLTNNKVDIMVDDKNFKSTYQITKELAEVWGDLSDITKANILEKIGGKRNANTLSGLITNFGEAEKVLETSLNSAGSAVKENENYLDSIAGKTELLRASFEDLSTSFLSSDLFKFGVSFLTKIVDGLDAVVDHVGSLATALAALGAIKTFGKVENWVKVKFPNSTAGTIKTITSEFSKLTASGMTTKEAISSLGKSFLGTISPLTAVTAGIGAAVAIYGIASTAIENYNQKLVEQRQQAAASAEEYNAMVSSVDEYEQKIRELREALGTGLLNENEAQSKRAELVQIERDLIKEFGNEAAALDLLNGNIKEQIDLIEGYKGKSFDNWKKENKSAIDDIVALFTDFDNAPDVLGVFDKTLSGIADGYGNLRIRNILNPNILSEYSDVINSVFEKYDVQSLTSGSDYSEFLIPVTDIKQAYSIIGDLYDAVEKFKNDNGGDSYEYADAIDRQLEEYSELYKKIGAVITDNEKTFNTYAEGVLSDKYSELYSRLITYRKEYEDAIISNDTEAIESAYNKIEGLKVNIDGVDDAAAKKYLTEYFDDFEDQTINVGAKIKISAALDDSDSNISKIVNDYISAFSDINGKIDKQLIEQAEIDFNAYNSSGNDYSDNAKVKAYGMLADAANEYGITVSGLIDILSDLESIQTVGAAVSSAVLNTYSEMSTKAELLEKNISVVTNALSEQGTSGQITKNTYDALTKAGDDYTKLLEYNGHGLAINTEKAEEFVSSLREASIAETEAAQSSAIDEWRENIFSVVRAQNELINSTDDTKSAIQGQISSYLSQASALSDVAVNYQILLDTLNYENSGYKKWLDSQDKNVKDSGEIYDRAFDAYKELANGFYYRKIGTVGFKAAEDFLIPEDVAAKGTAAVEEYSNSIKKYFKEGKEGWKSIQSFLDEGVENKLFSLEDGIYSVNAGVTTDDVIDKLHITKDLLLALIGEAEEYGHTFSFADESVTNAMLSVQKYVEALGTYKNASKEFTSALPDNSDYSKLKKNYSDASKTLKKAMEELKSYSPEILAKLGIKVDKESSDEDKERAIKDWIESGGVEKVDIEVDAEIKTKATKNNVADVIEEYKKTFNEHMADLGDLDAIDRLNNLIGIIELLPEETKVKFNIDTSLLEYGIIDMEQFISDLTTAVEELNNLDPSIDEESFNNAKEKVDSYVRILNSLPEEVVTKYDLSGFFDDNGNVNRFNLANSLLPKGVDDTVRKQEEVLNKFDEILQKFVAMKDTTDLINDNIDKAVNILLSPSPLLTGNMPDGWFSGFFENTFPKLVSFIDNLGTIKELIEGLTPPEGHEINIFTKAASLIATLKSVRSLIKDVDGDHKVSILADVSSAFEKIQKLKDFIEGIKDKVVTITTGTSNVHGSFSGAEHGGGGGNFANGTANAGGNWGLDKRTTSLTGELGREIIVDPNTGKWYTVGDYGAEFADLPKGAIVFNHKQTESLLKYGKVAGRGKSLASGTAMVTGGGGSPYKPTYDWSDYISTESSSKSSSNSSTSKSSNTTAKEIESAVESGTKKGFDSGIGDLIPIFFDRIERRIESLDNFISSSFKRIEVRSAASYDSFDLLIGEIDSKGKAAELYKKAADALPLSETIKKALREGKLSTEEIRGSLSSSALEKYREDENQSDEDVFKNVVNKFKEYYENYLDSLKDIEDLQNRVGDAIKQNFDNIQRDFENQLSLLEHETNTYTNILDDLETKGYKAQVQYYEALNKIEAEKLAVYNKEYEGLTKEFKVAMESGAIEEYSEAWYEFVLAIDEVSESIQETNTQMVQYTKEVRQLLWDEFDNAREAVDDMIDENDFIVDLIDSYEMFDQETGKIQSKGVTAIALRLDSLQRYTEQAKSYANEVANIEKMLNEDPENQDLIKRRKELLELQMDSIKAAKSEKDAIKDLVKDGIDLELKALKNLIDKYEESLDTQKDMYDYQKNVSEQTSEIADLRKQLAAYSGDTSDESRRRIQELQNELRDAEENLNETEYDRFISDQKTVLDDLYTEYEEILNKQLDDMSALISQLIGVVDLNYGTIINTLNGIAADVGYVIRGNWDLGFQLGDIDGADGVDAADARLALLAAVKLIDLTEEQARRADVDLSGDVDAEDARRIMRAAVGLMDFDEYLKEIGIKGYSSGGLVTSTGLAMLHGSASNPEIVFNSKDSNNLILLRDTLRDLMNNGAFSSGLNKIASGRSVTGTADFGDINITIPIDHVDDYNDFIRNIQNDTRFEKLVKSMSVDLLAGASRLGKYNI